MEETIDEQQSGQKKIVLYERRNGGGKKRVSPEEIEKARNIDLIDYLEKKGEKLIRKGKNYIHADHDSLVIKENGLFYWNSRQKGGTNAIDFCRIYYGLSFVAAVNELNSSDFSAISEIKRESKKTPPFSYEEQKKLEVQDTSRIRHYLINERKIDPKLVDWLIKKGLIAQDKRNNVIFKWIKDGEIVGFDLQGTTPMKGQKRAFKYISPNDKPHNGFTIDIGKPKSIKFFESSIDLLSFWSIKKGGLKDVRLKSMNGLKKQTVSTAIIEAVRDDKLPLTHISFNTDNDAASLEFINEMKRLINRDIVKTDIPEKEGFDWNDVLKELRKKMDHRKEQELIENIKHDRFNKPSQRQVQFRE
ncbi:DUF3991 domain-containing protein [Bacillus sp. TE9122W]